MTSEWREARLGDVLTLKRGYDLPKPSREPGDIPIVSSSGVSGSHSEAKVAGPGVVTGRYGTIGQVFYVDGHFWPLNTTLYVQDFKGNRPRYIKYLLETLDFHQFSDKAAVPGVNRNHLHEALVLVPPPSEQERIETVLAMLEWRIDNLRQTNATLEAIAQALFKSWFVDFDPVRAKAEGREPEGMDPATAALFPSEFEDSELGPIPKGWYVGQLRDVCRCHDSKRIPLSGVVREKRQGVYPYYGAASVMDYIDDYIFDGTFVLLAEDGSVSTKSGFAMTQYIWGKTWINNHAHVLDGSGAYSTEQLLLHLQRVQISEFVTGAVQAKVSQASMFRIPVVISRDPVLRAFSDIMHSIFGAIRNNTERMKLLSSLRDTLLPRLISGRLRLSEVVALVE